MTDKEKIRKFLVGMSTAACCDHQVAKAIEKIILPYIDAMPEDPVSEDLDKFAIQSANKLYPPEYEMADDNWKQRAGYVKGCKDGAKWQKQQLMKSAVKGVVHHFGDDEIAAIHYNDPKGVPMSYFVSSNDLKAGDNVKLITIKEE